MQNRNPSEPDPMEPWLFSLVDIPEVAVPVNEASPEWQDAIILRAFEHIRFDPAKLAAYEAALPPSINGREFLDYMIERTGGRSQ